MRFRILAGLPGLAAWAVPGLILAQTFDPLDLSGEELFMRYCAACHGSDARGLGPVAQTLNKVVPNLTRLAERNGGEFPAEAVRDAIDGRAMAVSHGTRQMPVWGYEFWVDEGADIIAERTTREMINRLVAWLESIQTRDEPAGFE
jgi:mono/diheme cytochrome c family protein